MGRSSIQKLWRLRRRSLYTLYFDLRAHTDSGFFVFNFLLHTASPLFCALLIDANVDLIKLLARIGFVWERATTTANKRERERRRRETKTIRLQKSSHGWLWWPMRDYNLIQSNSTVSQLEALKRGLGTLGWWRFITGSRQITSTTSLAQ